MSLSALLLVGVVGLWWLPSMTVAFWLCAPTYRRAQTCSDEVEPEISVSHFT